MSPTTKERTTWIWMAIGIVLVFAGFVTVGIVREPVTMRSLLTGGWLLLGIGVVLIVWTLVADRAVFREFFAKYALSMAFVLALLVGLFLPEAFVETLRPVKRIPAWMTRIVVILVLQGIAVGLFLRFRDRASHLSERAAEAANVTFLLQVGLGLLLMLNVISANHMTRWLGTYDATETGLYSLSDRTRGLLDGLSDLPAPVHAVYMDFGTAHQAAFPGDEIVGDRAKDFLEQYGDYTPRLKVREFNGIREKAEAEAFLRDLGVADSDLPFEDTVVFLYRPEEDGEPHRNDVTIRSATFLDRSALGTRKFRGEQHFTKAIQDVTLPKRKVYFLSGHDERPLYGTDVDSLTMASELVRRLSMDVEKLTLAGRGGVPGDADLVVVAGPRRPLATGERDAIIDYLENGGALMLLVDPQTSLLAGAPAGGTGLEPFLRKM